MLPSLRNYWHPVAKIEEVSAQPKQFHLLDEDLVLFRTDSGVVALRDLCIHRGTALSLGWVQDGTITCAYHGWQYDKTGACIRIPSLPAGSPIPPKARTHAYQADEAYGVVWVNLADPVAPVPPFPDGLFDDPKYRTFLAYDGVWSTSAGRAVENFLDVSHFAWVHENILGSRDNPVIPQYQVDSTNFSLAYTIRVPQPSAHDYYIYTLHLPFTAHIEGGRDGAPEHDYISIAAAPISAKKTRIFVWRGRDHSFEKSDAEIGEFQTALLMQDRAIVESQRPEAIPLDLRDEVHLKVPDAVAISYRKLLAEIDHTGSYMP